MENGYLFLLDKALSNERISLIGNDEIIGIDSETVKIMNSFFSDIVTNLNVTEYHGYEDICESISDPILKTILKSSQYKSY